MKREEQQTLQPLAIRVVHDETLQLADRQQMATELQLRGPTFLDRHQTKFLEPLGFQEQRLVVVQALERRTTPFLQGTGESRHRGLGRRRGSFRTCAREHLEPRAVELVG